MKLRQISLIAGAIALSFTTIPQRSVQAEIAPKAPLQLAQQPAQKPAPAQQAPQPLRIQLSEQQQQKIASIRANVRDQIKNVLTKQQRDQIESAMKAGQPPQQAFAALQFTQKQQQDLQRIMKSSQEQMEAVLTPAQKQELARYRQALQQQQTQPRK